MARMNDGRGPYLPYGNKQSVVAASPLNATKKKKRTIIGSERRKNYLPPKISYRNQDNIMRNIFGNNPMNPRK